MFRYKRRIIYIFLLICWVTNSVKSSEYVNQPKIYTEEENLIIECPRNNYINFELMQGSKLLINDVDVYAKAKELKLQNDNLSASDLIDFDNEAAKKILDQLTGDLLPIQTQLNKLKHMSSTQNVSRILNRSYRLLNKLRSIQKIFTENRCKDTNGEMPCKNGGVCLNTYPNFYCQCPEGWTGQRCNEDVDECYEYAGTDLGCQNKAICENLPGTYRCKCQNGYAGTHCRLKEAVCDRSKATELCGHGTCVETHNSLGYTCVCDVGWAKDNTTLACVVDVDECQEHLNKCQSDCINLPGSFKCGACAAGYTGNGLICLDVDECSVNNGGCSMRPFVKCINTEGSFHCGSCPPGWTGNGRECEELPSNSCNKENICHPLAKCEYVSGTPVCSCPHGMFGHGFGKNGCHQDEEAHLCNQHECKVSA